MSAPIAAGDQVIFQGQQQATAAVAALLDTRLLVL